MKNIILLSLSLIFFTACSPKVNIQALQPAQVDSVSQTKIIAMHNFKDDSMGLSSKIQTLLASKKIDNKNYFTLVSREDIKRILHEQKLQDSGLLDEGTAVELGNLLGAQALITGSISNKSSSDARYYVKRSKCVDKECKQMKEYSVACTTRTINLSAQIRIVAVEKGDIIFGDNLHAKKEWSACSDRNNVLPSKAHGLDLLSSKLARDFSAKLTPYYKNFSVVLLDEPDLEYTQQQEKILENALIYIERQRYTKADDLLSRLLSQTQERSFVAAYNLGVVKEVQGSLQEAQELYALADNLSIEPVEEIDFAIRRISRSITSRHVALEQIKK